MGFRIKYLLSKIDVSEIVKDHFGTLVNANTEKADYSDWFTFLVLPILSSGLLTWFFGTIGYEVVGLVIASLTIFIGLLLNLLILLYDIILTPAKQSVKFLLLKEMLSNISFSILLSATAITVLLFSLIKVSYVDMVLTYLAYFLLCELGITILLVFKRMYIMYSSEIKARERSYTKDNQKAPIGKS